MATRQPDTSLFRHILVPLDLSDRNTRILAAAGELARLGWARLTLLHVIQRVEGIPLAEMRGFYRHLETAAKRKLHALARRLSAGGVQVRAAVMVGNPARDIVAFADARGVDLIVMGSHRVDLSRHGRGLGTTSYKVAVLCRCPVLLAK